jgi:hypothetical protein
MTEQIDHDAKVYGRMHELLRESEEKEREILAKIADLKQRAFVLRGDPLDMNQHPTVEANAEAARMEREVVRLANVDLVLLRSERPTIRQLRTPELSRMLRAANAAIENAKADHTRKLLDDLTEARGALGENLRKLATEETFRLAQAVADAALAMGTDEGASIDLIDSSVPALLLERDSRKAAA